MSDSDSKGFSEGLSASKGDPRVLLVMNAALSTMLGWTVVGGLSYLDVVGFNTINVATAAILIFALTYLVTMS